MDSAGLKAINLDVLGSISWLISVKSPGPDAVDSMDSSLPILVTDVLNIAL